MRFFLPQAPQFTGFTQRYNKVQIQAQIQAQIKAQIKAIKTKEQDMWTAIRNDVVLPFVNVKAVRAFACKGLKQVILKGRDAFVHEGVDYPTGQAT